MNARIPKNLFSSGSLNYPLPQSMAPAQSAKACGKGRQSLRTANLPVAPAVCTLMHRALLLLVLLTSSACVSVTAGIDTTPIVASNGDPDLVSMGTLGFGVALDRKSAINIEVDVGASLRSTFLLGESLSYTHIGSKGGWRAGVGGHGTPLESHKVRLRAFGQYVIPFRQRDSSSHSGSEKFTLFSFRQSSYWTLAVGPEVSTYIREGNNRIAMGLGFRIGWFWMQED